MPVTQQPNFEVEFDWTPATFGQVVNRYQLPIYRFIYAMVCEVELAQDLTQDTFLAAYRGLCRPARNCWPGRFEPNEDSEPAPLSNNLPGWLYTIARNTTFTYLRRRRLVRFLPLLRLHRFDPESEAEEWPVWLETGVYSELEAKVVLQDELSRAINCLGREKVIALLLHLDGFSYREICQITGDTMSNVKVKIFRAKADLRRTLAPLQTQPASLRDMAQGV
jgi:RNA polymerase sigma-70 factor (ECF subfamily)